MHKPAAMSKVFKITRRQLPKEYRVPIVVEGKRLGGVIEYSKTEVTYSYWETRPFFSERTLTFKRKADAKKFVKWCKAAVPDYTVSDKQ